MHTFSKKFASVVKIGAPAILVAGLLFSCQKEGFGPGVNSTSVKEVTDPATRQRVVDQSQKMPAVGIYNKKMDKVIVFRQLPNGQKNFTFANPPANGINFATSNGGQWQWSESQGMVVITEPGQSLGGGGGTVVAGSTTLDIGYAFCFAVGDEVLGGDLFDTGIDEVAGVIGIAGDLDALVNGEFDEDDDFFEYFHGFAYYLVYTDQLANQSYDVLSWMDDMDNDDLDNFAFAYIVSFLNDGGIYLSKDGTITINGGSMSFMGNYYGIEGLGYFDDEGNSWTVVEVPGFGTMGCE